MEECWQLFKQWVTTVHSVSSPDNPVKPEMWKKRRKNVNAMFSEPAAENNGTQEEEHGETHGAD